MILLYTDAYNCRSQRCGMYHELVRFAIERQARCWAIYLEYRQGQRFHNATDADYLVDHDDPYWHRRGVPGPVGKYPNDLKRQQRAPVPEPGSAIVSKSLRNRVPAY